MKISHLFFGGLAGAIILGTIFAVWLGGAIRQGGTDRADAMAAWAGLDTSSSPDGFKNNVSDESQTIVSSPAASMSRHEALIAGLTIFVLSIFVGFEIITKVPPTLHTPLMSGSNAVSGITLVGAVIVTGGALGAMMPSLLGMIAVALATINVIGGFLVTHRMLAMFKKK